VVSINNQQSRNQQSELWLRFYQLIRQQVRLYRQIVSKLHISGLQSRF
jgi:hypothetical protein